MVKRRHGCRWSWALTLACLLLAGAAPTAASGATLAPGFWTQTVVDGLPQPTAIAWTPDGRMLVAEKPGVVRVVQADGALDPAPLIDISDKVNDAADRGLLGIAVAPDFATSGEVYLLYVYDATYAADPASGQDSGARQVSRLTRIVVDSKGQAGPEQTVLGSVGTSPCPAASNTLDCIPADALSHAIGTVRAASDGTLWVGSGDASTTGTADPRALGTYDEQSLRGKILHVDRDGHGLPGHPFCPGDSDLGHVCTKVYAKGFRNPFRFGLRPGAGPVVGDVGWNTREEVDRLVPGANYGWPCYEGSIHTPGYSDFAECPPEYAKEGTSEADTAPDYDYGHSAGTTVIAGFPYAGTAYPKDFLGQLVFGDYSKPFVSWLDFGAAGGPAVTPLADGLIAVDLEPAPDNGDVVYVGYSPAGEGLVGRIVYSPTNGPPTAVAGADVTSGSSPLTVHFDAGESSDPDDDDLDYHWSFGDGSADSDEAAPTHVFDTKGAYQVRLRVEDPGGLAATDRLTVAVDDKPPVATISAPDEGDTYADGNSVQLKGSATDPDEGELAGSRLTWDIVLHHNTHVHPLLTRTGAEPVFQTSTEHDADSFYEIALTATDSAGLTDTETVTIHPRTIQFGIDSVPPGAPVSYAGVAQVAPWQTTSAVGFHASISADESFHVDGRKYVFDHWSDGGERLHDIVIPATDTTRTAHYREQNAVVGGEPPPPAPDAAPPADFELAQDGLTVPGPTDARGPAISFVPRGFDLRRGRLAGRVSDASGVQEVDVALRAHRDRRAGCRWWSTARTRLRGRSSCKRPLWIRARVRGRHWSADLGAPVPRGNYVAFFRARDAWGNLSRASAATRSTT